MRKLIDNVTARLKFYFDRRFSTIAGTLVYFLLMSITPFMLWLSLVLGKVDVSRFLNMRMLENIAPFLRYLKSSAESAASGAGIILLATSLYSSSNFFYHLRRSGEIIYDGKRKKGGIKLRIASLALIISAIVLIGLIGGISVIGTKFLESFLPFYISDIISSVFLTALLFSVALVLNIFACPYKMKLYDAVQGSLLTTALWLALGIGFGIYASFANPERLYGKIAAVIIFLLWCYVMMCVFVIGVLENKRVGTFKKPLTYNRL